MTSEPSQTPSRLPMGAAAGFYAAMTALAVLLGWLFDLNIFEREGHRIETPLMSAVYGVGFGVAIVALSHALQHSFEWARRLNVDLAALLGKITWLRAFGLAFFSGIAEELLFRGFFQRAIEVWTGNVGVSIAIAGVVFGLVHIGPEPRRFAPWTIMAVVLGWMIGVLYAWTGSVIAPIAAHFVINFLNLSTLIRRASES